MIRTDLWGDLPDDPVEETTQYNPRLDGGHPELNVRVEKVNGIPSGRKVWSAFVLDSYKPDESNPEYYIADTVFEFGADLIELFTNFTPQMCY